MINVVFFIVAVFVLQACGIRTPKEHCEAMCEHAAECSFISPTDVLGCRKLCLKSGSKSKKCYNRTKEAVQCMDGHVCGEGRCYAELLTMLKCWPPEVVANGFTLDPEDD